MSATYPREYGSPWAAAGLVAQGPQFASPATTRRDQSASLINAGSGFVGGSSGLSTPAWQRARPMPNELRSPRALYPPQVNGSSHGRPQSGHRPVQQQRSLPRHGVAQAPAQPRSGHTFLYPTQVELDDDDDDEVDDQDDSQDEDEDEYVGDRMRYIRAPSPPPTNRMYPPGWSRQSSASTYNRSRSSQQQMISNALDGRWPPQPARQQH